MRKNDLLRCGDSILRVLDVKGGKAFVIDCRKRNIPYWMPLSDLKEYTEIAEQELLECFPVSLPDVDSMDANSRRVTNERFTMIAAILPIVSDFQKRNQAIATAASEKGISRQTVINHLCLYLVYQNKTVLAPKPCLSNTTLTANEKNFRWALNKFFYTKNKNSLKTAYTLMLKERYCDGYGVLLPEHPTFNQFRYFYRKHKKLQTYYISRNGIKDYQRNHRPLLGDGVQEYAASVGVGMVDATVCDIYLVNEAGNLIGRPILTACVDAYSGLCCGYSLSWEGGVYSLRGLMLNVVADKKAWCSKFGVVINKADWDSDKIPGKIVSDMGAEYASETFEQLAELEIEVVNLPAFRPELKGAVEKFFDVLQDLFKPYLKGKGVIEPDYQERGAHDYRKDACLTMADFERVLLRCIVYYNSQRVIENYPYTAEMIAAEIPPYANAIFEWGKSQEGANLLAVDRETLVLTLLPRTIGKFSRNGLKVNKMRYKHDGYTEQYLMGGEVTVAYNPDDVSFIWLIENGAYIRFELIESRFKGLELSEVQTFRNGQKSLVQSAGMANTQAKIDLASHIITIARNSRRDEEVSINGIRETRQRERNRNHIDFVRAGVDDE